MAVVVATAVATVVVTVAAVEAVASVADQRSPQEQSPLQAGSFCLSLTVDPVSIHICHAGLEPESIFCLLSSQTGEHGSPVEPGMTKRR